MIYKLSLFARNTSFMKRMIRKTKKLFSREEEVDNVSLVKKYVRGKSFADIGCMWGIDGLNSFLAEANGASEVIAVDIYPESEKFLEEKRLRNSRVRFVMGDINLPETTDQIGMPDVVLCSGVLYHTPDPFHLLTRLRTICKETLILNTQSIPEMPGIRNAAVFYPFLDAKQRKIWNRGIGSQRAITGPYEPQSGYGNWFWGMTPSSIESMLCLAGFEVKERYVSSFDCIFVCQAAPIQFVAESGAWTTPKDREFVKFQR